MNIVVVLKKIEGWFGYYYEYQCTFADVMDAQKWMRTHEGTFVIKQDVIL